MQTDLSLMQSIWNFKMWAIDNNPVTVKKLMVALCILILGIVLLKYLIRAICKRLLPRTRLGVSAAVAIEKLLYYAGVILIALFALRVVNIPLTVFTLFGGAIAIGAGFGAQHLINNFISGFIIMAERPIKIGDMIEVEGTIGTVEDIGARCTRIRTGSNIHMLVPNSSFLEKNIINWTFADQIVRAQVTAGVAYGADVRKAEQLMVQSAIEHEKILKDPKPFVLFNNFAENALVFDVYFWITMHHLAERHTIESDIRFRIHELLQEAGIELAGPLRGLKRA